MTTVFRLIDGAGFIVDVGVHEARDLLPIGYEPKEWAREVAARVAARRLLGMVARRLGTNGPPARWKVASIREFHLGSRGADFRVIVPRATPSVPAASGEKE